MKYYLANTEITPFLGNEIVNVTLVNPPVATGGLTGSFVSGGLTWQFHDFLPSSSAQLTGTFNVSSGFTNYAKILVVGGGAGGGNAVDLRGGGGGGAGQVIYVDKFFIESGSYTIAVGAGSNASGTNQRALQGGTSTAFTYSSEGGGGGSGGSGAINGDGGSVSLAGGGGATKSAAGGTGIFKGGNGGTVSNSNGGGGGGGASSAGADVSGTNQFSDPGDGGSGLAFTLKGTDSGSIVLVGAGGGGGIGSTSLNIGEGGSVFNGFTNIIIGGRGGLDGVGATNPVAGSGSGGGGSGNGGATNGAAGRVIIVYPI